MASQVGELKAAWQALERRFDPKRRHNKFTMIRSMVTEKCKDGNMIEAWMAHKADLKTKLDSLPATEKITTEDSLIMCVLEWLPEAVSDVAPAKENLTYTELKRMIVCRSDKVSTGEDDATKVM